LIPFILTTLTLAVVYLLMRIKCLKNGFPLMSERSYVLAVDYFDNEEKMKSKIYFNSDKKCGDNV
jgi:hypothetical protein